MIDFEDEKPTNRKVVLMKNQKIVRDNYTVEVEASELYVDNKSRKRSGHMSHAMVEFAPGCILDFNSSCSAERKDGHTPHGWVEYRISRDNSKTWSDARPFPYSWDAFIEGIYVVSVEKAVVCDDGTIVAFCLRNDATSPWCCEPWSTPMVVTSTDGGETWSDPVEYSPYPGRTYEVRYHEGVIYAMHFCNPVFLGTESDHVYRLYVSEDNGKTFSERCVIPFDTRLRGYCTMLFDTENRLHAYTYHQSAECFMDHAISEDFGKTWQVLKPCYLQYGIRNPQTALIDGVFILHGRDADGKDPNTKGFVLYTSLDGTNWDEGHYLAKSVPAQYYSNNLNLKDENGNFLLIQFDESYSGAKVDVYHTRLRIRR